MRITRRWRVVLVSFAALFLIAPARPVFVDPAFVFVEVDGVSRGAFATIDGPGLEIEVVEFREGATTDRPASSPDARSTSTSR